MSHIFISYSRKDLDLAQRIVTVLAADNLDTWIDWKSIPKGEDWEQEIYHGIESAEAFIFLISPESVSSEICNKEIAHAIRNGKRILPVFIADVDDKEIYTIAGNFLQEENRTEIGRRNFIKCREGRDDFDTAVVEIRTTIHTDYEWLKYHTRLQAKALEWNRSKDASRLLRGKELQDAQQQLAGTGTKRDPQPTIFQRQFVLASRTDADRRRRRTITGLAIGFVVLLGLCAIAVGQRDLAVSRENTAVAAQAIAEEEHRVALSNDLVTQARVAFDDQLDLSLLLAVLSGQIILTTQAAEVLHDALEHRPDLVQYLNGIPSGGVTHVAYTPDESQLVAVAIDGSILRWDLDSGRLVGDPIQSPGQTVLGLTLGQRGEIWTINIEDTGVFVWDASNKEQLGSTIFFTEDVNGNGQPDLPSVATLSPDGSTLATAVAEEISLWEVRSGQLLGKSDILLGFPPSTLEFSPDASILASAGNEWQIFLWDGFNGANLSIWPTSQSNITSLAFSADGRYIASGSVDGIVILFDGSTGEQILRQPGYRITTGREIPPPALDHPAGVRSVALSPDGETLVSGAVDGNMLVWDTNTMTPMSAPKTAYVGPILALAWNPDSKTFAVGGGDDAITIWEPTENWRLLRPQEEADMDLNFIKEPTQIEETGEQNSLRVTNIISEYTAVSGCVEVIESYEPCPEGYVEAYQPDGQPIDLQSAELLSWPKTLTFNADGTMLAATTCQTTSGYDCPESNI